MVSKAVSSWSLHRTLGRFFSSDGPTPGGRPNASPAPATGLALLDLPAALRAHGFEAVQICHFHLPSRSESYLAELRASLAEADVRLESLLIDDGDLTDPEDADRDEAWIAGWLETAAALGATSARVCAGRSTPTAERIADSASRLKRLATGHPAVRVVTENWMEMMPDAATVNAVLDAAGPSVGLLIDLGNWRGPEKYQELAAIAPRAESCHAKCHFTADGPDADDFRSSLNVLRSHAFSGPMVLIYDGPDGDEWAQLDREWTIVTEVFH